LLVKPLGNPEHPAVLSNVLAQNDNAGIPLHLLLEGEIDRFDHGQLGHIIHRLG
jgi:hypothetical protein